MQKHYQCQCTIKNSINKKHNGCKNRIIIMYTNRM